MATKSVLQDEYEKYFIPIESSYNFTGDSLEQPTPMVIVTSIASDETNVETNVES